jgi:cullin-associated NEDD8-dissociated protein 1
LLQGQTLTSLFTLAQQIGSLSFGWYCEIQSLVFSTVEDSFSSQNCNAAAHCISCITGYSAQEKKQVVDLLYSVVQSGIHKFGDIKSVVKAHVALLTLSKVGEKENFKFYQQIDGLLMSALDSPTERIRNAASYALGHVIIGNTKELLPTLLQRIQQQHSVANATATASQNSTTNSSENSKSMQTKETQQVQKLFHFLNAANEVITEHTKAKSCMQYFISLGMIDQIVDILLGLVSSNQDNIQIIVAECLGGLCVIDGARLFPKLEQLVTTSNANIRAAVITAVRFSVEDNKSFANCTECWIGCGDSSEETIVELRFCLRKRNGTVGNCLFLIFI